MNPNPPPYLRLLVAALYLLLPSFSQAQKVLREERIVISFPNMPLPVILGEYEQLTGMRIVRDNAVLGATLSIETQQELNGAEAAEFIEKSLLLNGFALIPSGKDTLKIVAFSDGKQPISEGVPVITRKELLPENDKVVTYLLPLSFITPAEAQKALSDIFTVHSYGKFVTLDSSSALAITENSFTIQKMIEVLDRFDLPPTEISHQTILLERADPEDVVEAIIDLLDLDESSEGESKAPNSLDAATNGGRINQVIQGDLARSRTVKPKLRAIPKSNKILVVGRPHDIKHIETLVSYFDEPIIRKHMVKRKLNYISVSTLLPVAQHTLERTTPDQSSASSIAGGEVTDQPTVSTGNVGGSIGASNSQEIQEIGPQSVIVGKTLLIADSIQNTLHMSGPDEDLATLNELIDSMDIKPRQILISVVIAQLTLDKDFEYGVDFLRTLEGSNSGSAGGVFRSRSGSIVNPDGLNNFDNLLPAVGGLSLYGQINPHLDTIMSALESQSRFKVLSRPMIYTLNNRRAEILSGQRIAVPRSRQSVLSPNQNNTNQVVTASIDFEEVLLRIEVIPLINAEDRITLQIAQSNEDIVGNQVIGGDQIPTIGTQALKTTVIVPNGGTILLGGLISEEDSKTKTGVPIMVNLPLVGDVFGNTKVEKERQELMIFIQPRIVDDEYDRALTNQDLSERSEFLEETMDFAKPETEAWARPVAPQKKKRGLIKRIFQLDKMDVNLTSPGIRTSSRR